MFYPNAKVIEDSISPEGARLTTIECEIHRFVLAEFNTHRVFSRNSASSRAIPYSKMRDKALNSPALPLSWPQEQKGMQGGAELPPASQEDSQQRWLDARDAAVEAADKLHKIGLHKSVINRLLEPFLPHKIIVSATNWAGFWAQRCHPDAQPEIRVAAEAMRDAWKNSTPKELGWGQWHLPYIADEERQEFPLKLFAPDGARYEGLKFLQLNPLLQISAARCARVSYLTHDGKRDLDKDLELFGKLIRHKPAHASPLEHVATPGVPLMGPIRGNFVGWSQLRHKLGLN